MKKLATKKNLVIILILCVLALSVLFAVYKLTDNSHEKSEKTVVNVNPPGSASKSNNLGYLQSIINTAKDNYNGEITDQKLVTGALQGVFNSMDPYTVFFTKDEYKTFFGDVSGKYCGVGITIEKSSDYIVVTKVYAASPAEKMGIMPGDRIVQVDGKNVLKSSVDEVVNLIKGPNGSSVKLGIIRNSETDVKTIEISRAEINVNPVTYDIRGNIGYIMIDKFNTNTEKSISEALKKIDEKGITNILIDLRNNTGGIAGEAVALANYFIPKGLVSKVKFKSSEYKNMEYSSSLDKQKYKFAVLVNGMSASASELFAGAVQDTASGKLVGTKTFGKAKVQNIFPIMTPEACTKYEKKFGVDHIDVTELYNKYKITPSDSDLIGYAKITIGYYYTPKGRLIDLKGITPDYIVNDPSSINNINILNVKKLSCEKSLNLNMENIDVYNAESILKIENYSIGTPDVKLDADTVKALKVFQGNNNIKVTGTLDTATQAKLNENLDSLIPKYDLQYAKGIEILNN